jgi:sec-independent protein translocase protein TatB
MPDIGWMELLLIGIVALIVVGPKDLPMMFRRLGQFTGRIRAMARDFQRAMDDAADETGMKDINRDLRNAARYSRNPVKAGTDALKDAFGDIDPDKYPEGSHTRAAAEKRKAEAAAIREKAAELRTASETSQTDDPASPDAQPSSGSDAAPEPANAASSAPPRTGTDAS